MQPIRLLSPEQMERIDDAAMKILEETGMVIQSGEALDLLEKAGCKVDRATSLARFPRQVVKEAVARMKKGFASPGRPERMPVRFSHVRFRAAPYEVHRDFTVSAGGFNCFLLDLGGVKRKATMDDVLSSINMVNRLDQIDLSGLPVSDQTLPPDKRPIVMAATLAKYTTKIGGIETFRVEDVGPIIDIAEVAAGSAEAFRIKPRLVGYAEIRSPLCFDRNMVDIFLAYVKRGVPQTVDTMPCGGATAPVTAAGVLALGVAETLAPVVLAYAVRDDAVVGVDITPSYADMSSGIFKYSGADRWPLLMARVQLLAEFYGVPTGVHGGKTDSCFLGEQAGAEKMGSMLLPVLAGAVGIGTVGQVENAVTFSPTQLVIDNEIARCVRRVIRPIEVTDDTLSADLVKTVGPGGNFLNEMHTAAYFRDEMLLSPLFSAHAWDRAHGDPERHDTVGAAAQTARELWKKPERPVLSDDQVKAIDAIVKRATGL